MQCTMMVNVLNTATFFCFTDFAGLQNGNECWCGDSTYDKNGQLDAATQCNKNCIGECGGVSALTVYDTAQSDYEFPSAAPSTYMSTWAEDRKLACVLDTWDRAMVHGPKDPGHVNSPGGMTVQACITYCEGLNYAYAGKLFFVVLFIGKVLPGCTKLLVPP